MPDDLKVLPELDKSYTPFREFPLVRPRGPRWNGWRNMMVAAINAGIEQRLFGLSPGENWWPGAAKESHECERGVYRFALDGLPALVGIDAISGDELSLSVVLNPKQAELVPYSHCDLADGDAAAHGWLERRLGAWIQDSNEAFHCRRALLPRLAGLDLAPQGYSDQGSFIM